MSDRSLDAHARRRSGQFYGVLSVLLLVSIVSMLNYLAFRHYRRWDWTEHSIYTLSERSKVVLTELDRDVEIWLLLSESEATFAELRNLLARYSSESSRLQVHFVDPDRNLEDYRRIAVRFGLGLLQVGEGHQLSDVAAVVAAGDRHWEITRDDLIHQVFPQDPGDNAEVQLDVESERALTGAIVQVISGRATKVCLTRGHGEYDLSGTARSLSALEGEMRRENLELEEIDTRGQRRIAEGCDVVAIIGPEVAFDEREAALLQRYLGGGGKMLIALDPLPNAEQTRFVPTGLEALMREAGVRAEGSLVLELNTALHPAGRGHPLGPYLVVDYGEHPITEPFRDAGLGLLVVEARSIGLLDETRGHVLLRSSEQSYAETDLASLGQQDAPLEADERDISGPVPLAVAIELPSASGGDDASDTAGDERSAGRLVVVGDANVFASEFMNEPTAINQNFASATLGWLTDRSALIAIPARSVQHRPVTMTEDDTTNLFIRIVILLPLAFVFLGFAVWWNRRQ